MKLISIIDKLSEWFALISTTLPPILAGVVFYDVIARYLFNAPTFWGYEISWMVYSAGFLLGLPYALREGAHIRVDVILNMCPPRLKAGIEAFFIFTTLLLLCCAVVWFGIDFAVESCSILEGSMLTLWAPPVYQIKVLIVLSFFMLGVQGIAELVRRLQIIFGGQSL